MFICNNAIVSKMVEVSYPIRLLICILLDVAVSVFRYRSSTVSPYTIKGCPIENAIYLHHVLMITLFIDLISVNKSYISNIYLSWPSGLER